MIKEVEIVASNPFGRRIEYFYDDISVGYLDFSIIYDRMEIDNLFVKEEYRGLGIATKLMSHVISIAIETRMINITLEVRISNEIARNLYKKFGFYETGYINHGMKYADGTYAKLILMQKDLK